jgi:hypothetical protein
MVQFLLRGPSARCRGLLLGGVPPSPLAGVFGGKRFGFRYLEDGLRGKFV